jgi:hypothetical protein
MIGERSMGVDSSRGFPWRCGLVAGALGYVAGAAVLVGAILDSPSSTAAIGFLFVPFCAVVPGLLGFALGCSVVYLVRWRRAPSRRPGVAALVSLAVLVLMLVGGGLVLAENGRRLYAVETVLAMDTAGLSGYFERGALRRDKFVLGAIAQNPAADALLLDEISQLEDPSLHGKMGSLFPVLGGNQRGLAVMRLVARHANVSTTTLVRLSRSPDAYVLSDVAGNAKTPVEELRSLRAQGGYLIEWGLARNPSTPSDALHDLAASENQYTRGSTAGNSGTPPEDLERLARDSVWHVRRSVAANPQAPPALLERLSADPDPRVARTATHRLSRPRASAPNPPR